MMSSFADRAEYMQTGLNIRGQAYRPAGNLCRWLSLVLVSLAASGIVHAVEVASLYTVEVPLDGSGPDATSDAYRRGLTEVLVRVTGDAARAQSAEVSGLFPNPDRYVTRYQPGPDNSLIVTFEGRAIEQILRRAGETVWGAERPLTIIWLAIDWGRGDREVVAAIDAGRQAGGLRSIDRNRQLRERIAAAAALRGIPTVYPRLDAEDMDDLSFSDIWGGFDDQLLAASARYGAESVLVGRFRPNDEQVPRWTWYMGGQRYAWPGEPESAIQQLADSMAAKFAIDGGDSVERVILTVSGIDSVVAYGEVQRYLENVRLIDKLVVRSVAADRISYELEVQGGVARLHDVLGASAMLKRVSAGFDARAPLTQGGNPGDRNAGSAFGDDRALQDGLQYYYQSPATRTAGPARNPGLPAN